MDTAPLLLASLFATACFESPTLDDFVPPPADLGVDTVGVDTWGPLGNLDPAAPGLDDGSSWGEGQTTMGSPAESGGIDPGPDPALDQLRLTEVRPDPPGKDGGPESPEYVELINLGPAPVDLGGLRIQALSWPILDGVELGLEGVELPAEGLLVIRRFADDVDPALGGVSVQGSIVFVGFLHDSGLRNGDGAIGLGEASDFADVVVYGASAAAPFDAGWLGEAAPTPDSGESLCRSAMSIESGASGDHDSAEDWASCPPSPGSLEAIDSGTDSGTESGTDSSDSGSDTGTDTASEGPEAIAFEALQIVEVLSNPPGPAASEKAWEYVEILNTSQNEVELAFVRIGDDPSPDAAGVDPLAFVSGSGGCASPTCLAPDRRALIVAQGYLGETGDALVLATDDSTIADGGLTNTEPVVIWDGLDSMISSYRLWPDPSAEPLPSDEQPLHRIDPLALDQPEGWFSAAPTPGL